MSNSNKTVKSTASQLRPKPLAIVLVGNGAGNIARRSKKAIFEHAVKQTKAIKRDQVAWVIMNTEAYTLNALDITIKADYSVLLGKNLCKGEGAGYNKAIGEAALAESLPELEKVFKDENGENRFSGAIIVHSELKGTGGGAALPLGLWLRDQLGMKNIIFQSIRPTMFECQETQLREAHAVADRILGHGFNTIEISNEISYNEAPEDAQMEDVYRSLDINTVRSWLAMIYVLLNPGSADVADFNRQILSSKAGGKRMVANYLSFPIPPKNATPEQVAETQKLFAEQLPKLLEFWGFHFEGDIRELLIVTHGGNFWNKGRIQEVQKLIRQYAEQLSTDEAREKFFPIFGGQDTIDKTRGKFAFVAVMATGEANTEAFEKVQSEVSSKQLDLVQRPSGLKLPPMPLVDPVQQPVMVAPKAETVVPLSHVRELPSDEGSYRKAFPRCQEKQEFLLEFSLNLAGDKGHQVREFLSYYSPENYVVEEAKASEETFENTYSEYLLSNVAIVKKFDQEIYLKLTSGSSVTLKATAGMEKICELEKLALNDESRKQVEERKKFMELFGEDLVLQYMVPSTSGMRHLGMASIHAKEQVKQVVNLSKDTKTVTA